MTHLFFQAIKKTWFILKTEPIILIPSLTLNLILTLWLQSGSHIKNSFLLNGILQWVVPSVIIQPFILCVVWQIIQKKNILFPDILKKQQKIIWAFFISSLYKPLMIFSSYQLIKKIEDMATDISSSNLSAPSISELISNNAIRLWSGCLILAVVFWLVMIYFQPYIVTRKDSRETSILIQIKDSIRIFFQFKWVTILTIIYFFAWLFFVLSFFRLAIPVFPEHYGILLLNCLDSLIGTVFYVFVFRLFIYIKPMINLDYN